VYVPSPAYGSYGFFPRSSFGYPYGYPYYSYPYMFDPFYATPFPSSEYPFNTYYYNPGAGSYSSQANSVLVSPDTAESDSAEAQPSPDSKPQITVLVFRDGHRIEVRDYAIAGDTLWILTEQRATKVPLSDLDLDQTIQVNQEHGIRFPVAPAAQQP
jgi:hypothetical protein